MRRLIRCALLTATALVGVPIAEAADRVALVIGNSAYKTQNFLANPVNDAADVGAMFRNLGFEVVEGLDLDGAGLRAKLKEFRDKLEGGTLAVFYYSGHGIQVDGRNYIIPTDARIDKQEDVPLETVEMDQVLQLMRADNRITVVVLDACRDNPFARAVRRVGKAGTRAAESAYGGLAEVKSSVGSVIIYATDPGNVAQDGEGRNSPFTQAFLKNAPQPGLEISRMIKRVRHEVVTVTGSRQVPWESSTLINDVYLAGGDPGPVQLAAYTPEPAATGAKAAANAGARGSSQPASAPATPVEPTAAELCDRLASDPQDTLRNRKVAPVRTVDTVRAIPACEKAVAEAPKDLHLANQLGRSYVKASRWSDALRVYKDAASRGSPYATNEIGFLYYRGFGGLKKDYAQARPWFEKAAQLGVPVAMTNLAFMYAHGIGTDKNPSKALMWLRKAEGLGDPGAMVQLAWYHAEGFAVERNGDKALGLMQRAADLEDPEGMTGLGLFAQQGVGGPQDFDRARKWFEKAAAYDSSSGMYNLGFFYMQGMGGAPRNHAIARDWFTRSMRHEGVDAMVGLAHMRLNGLGGPADPEGARELFEQAASHDHPKAMLYLGRAWRDGSFGRIDEEAAREWLRKAIALDDDSARELLAEMDRPETPGQTCDRLAAIETDPLRPSDVKGLAQPTMIVHDRAIPACEAAVAAEPETLRYADQLASAHVAAGRWEDARRVFEAAANRNSPFAALWMGNIHSRGRGVPKDAAAARKWWDQAAEGGSTDALYNLAMLYLGGEGGSEDPVKARQLLERAAELGDVAAMREVGEIWYFARGVAEDNTRAREWYEKAAEGGDTRAKRRLGEIALKGWGIKPDPVLARLWFQRAAAESDTVSMRMLADLYLNAIGGDREPAKARGLLEQAADEGDAKAMTALAQMLLAGVVGDRDEAAARAWYEKAAAAGEKAAADWLTVNAPTATADLSKGEACDAAASAAADPLRSVEHPPVDRVDAAVAVPACEAAHAADPENLRWANQLGRAYLFAKRDIDAVRTLREAAEAGSVYATVWMGTLNVRGLAGLAVNRDEAIRWWTKAADLGSAEAMYNIGMTQYARMLETPAPDDEAPARAAREWLEKAAELGDADAMLQLAVIHRNGQGVEADGSRYVEWITKAIDFGSTKAMRMVAKDLRTGAAGSGDDAMERRLLERALAAGDIEAVPDLAPYLIEGKGGPKDLARARALLEKAVGRQNTDAITTLAKAHETGLFGAPDKAEAKRLYRLAADLGDKDAAGALANLK